MIGRAWALSAVIVALLAFAPPTEAQKRCRKGIPCGNTCIAATKTCHVGSSGATTATPRTATAAPEPQQPDTAHAPAPWVGSSRGSTYYRSGCSGARQLSPANVIYFRTQEEAETAGYTRSRTRGC